MCDMKPFGELSDAEKGALLLAHHDGKRIEFVRSDGAWEITQPHWYRDVVYRIAPEPLIPDFIDWSHVAPEVVAIARGPGCEFAACYLSIPSMRGDHWFAALMGYTNLFASYRRGTVDWKDSLVRRPL